MKRFFAKTILTAFVIASMLPTVMQADLNTGPQVPPKVRYQLLANEISAKYEVPAHTVKKIINCESTWNVNAHKYTSNGPHKEDSYGLVQINLFAHPDITVKEAKDPEFAIDYLASNLANGKKRLWLTCSK